MKIEKIKILNNMGSKIIFLNKNPFFNYFLIKIYSVDDD
jgi:hypothetical protein